MMKRKIYLIGSLHNGRVPIVANRLREAGHEVFDDWHAGGPEADQIWRDYEKGRGRSYKEALYEKNATKNFEFDLKHLHWANTAVMLMPAGKSAHLELGYMTGRNRDFMPLDTFILIEGDLAVWDLMYRLVTAVTFSVEELIEELR